MVAYTSGPNGNFGIRHGTMSGQATAQTNHDLYLATSDVIYPGWYPPAFVDFIDYKGGPALMSSQCQAYNGTSTNKGRSWVKLHAAALDPDPFTLAVNLGGVLKGHATCGNVVDVMASSTTQNGACRRETLDALDQLQILQLAHPNINLIVQHGHENNGGWYPWGHLPQGTDNDADFLVWWKWVSEQAHARGLKTGWVLSIGPMINGGIPLSTNYNFERWPGAYDAATNPGGTDVLVLNWYDKASSDSNATDAASLAMLQAGQAFAVSEGVTVGFGEWAPGGKPGIGHMALTIEEMDSWPATGPGSLEYACFWNPSSGGSSPVDGGSIPQYYDITRAPGIAAYPCRAQFMWDQVAWFESDQSLVAPYTDISGYVDPANGCTSPTDPGVVSQASLGARGIWTPGHNHPLMSGIKNQNVEV